MKFRGNKDSPSLKELNELVNKAFAMWVAHTGPHTLWTSCISCIHANKTGPMYCQKYKLVPPVNVIVGEKDCEGWESQNEIPFG